ncbi:MAG: FadR/GntR family transcriptional regulator [Hyphomicrobiaceae bacterium]
MADTDHVTASLATIPGAGAITQRLRRAITGGVYADGDRIPPERQLATAFGAARSTVRKALDQLEDEGLLVRRVGAGTFVNYAGPLQGQTGEISDLISPLQLIDARLAVEPYMARLAALHATQRELDGMLAVLERLEDAGGDKDLFTELDSEFHLCIARGARNPLLLHVYETINAVRTRAQWNTVKEKILSPHQIAAYNDQHRAIYAAMTVRDAQRVAELLVAHLEKARGDLVGAHSA